MKYKVITVPGRFGPLELECRKIGKHVSITKTAEHESGQASFKITHIKTGGALTPKTTLKRCLEVFGAIDSIEEWEKLSPDIDAAKPKEVSKADGKLLSSIGRKVKEIMPELGIIIE